MHVHTSVGLYNDMYSTSIGLYNDMYSTSSNACTVSAAYGGQAYIRMYVCVWGLSHSNCIDP